MDEGPSKNKSLKCKLGIHKWEEKEFIFPQHKRICAICGKVQVRLVIKEKWENVIQKDEKD
jgi:hypothetical protein